MSKEEIELKVLESRLKSLLNMPEGQVSKDLIEKLRKQIKEKRGEV